ncbi:hydroxyphenylacetyl-CoA thioesterase PaaI [Dinoroseobacter sp. S375]|uniref:hydroxyphenylacetyl-CoA thioesterase PaaI n=1 Tax=Dinoroseobacter sp. S375 TaxID=3415136 RepID=UPI003C7E515B
MDPQTLAEASAAAMLDEDAASRGMGIALVQVRPGAARCHLMVRADHLNGHGICHGGVIFTLADTAFAVACNSYNQRVVAQHNSISYLAPARSGEELIAEAVEVSRSGRSGIYDVTVTQGETVVAVFRGASRQVQGQHVPAEAAQSR